MAKKFVASFGRRVARRVYHSRPKRGRVRKATVEIGTPAAVPGSDWGCRVRIRGLSSEVDRTVFGVDSVQALSIALMYSAHDGYFLARVLGGPAPSLGLAS